ncbi:MAG: ASCH domain-containing protein [Candidatus Muiribacteriota bacterium]|jgi:hypothetical protein
MDHVVYTDFKAKELDDLISGKKTAVLRGAAGRKLPHGRVNAGDILYFIQNNGEGLIQAKAEVKEVFNSDKMTKEESEDLIQKNMDILQLKNTQLKRWSGKRYLVIIKIKNVVKIPSFSIDKSDFSNMDDWLIVEDIKKVKISS